MHAVCRNTLGETHLQLARLAVTILCTCPYSIRDETQLRQLALGGDGVTLCTQQCGMPVPTSYFTGPYDL